MKSPNNQSSLVAAKGAEFWILAGVTGIMLFVGVILDALPYLLLAAIGVVFCTYFVRDSRVRFVSVLASVVLLAMKSEHGTVSILDILAGGLYSGGFLLVLLKKKFIRSIPFTPSATFIYFSIFLLWGVTISLVNIVDGTVLPEQSYRDLLLLICPLFLLPVFYSEILEEFGNSDQIFKWCILLLWIVVFCATILKMRNNVAEAYYAYQIGVARYDNINAGFMILLFFSLAMITQGTRRLLLAIGVIISLIGLFLTFGRTSWVATLVLLPVVIVLGKGVQVKRGITFGILVLGILIPTFAFMYFAFPIVRTASLLGLQKFFTSSHLKTDISMYNRYVEWRYAFKHILTFPMTGSGFGGMFWDYDWLAGISHYRGYIHNAAIIVLLKSGLVGSILLFTPCVVFFVKGFRYLRSSLLTIREIAYLRAGVAVMLFTLFTGYTGSLFFQRDMVLYIALFWCYIIGLEHKIGLRSQANFSFVDHEILSRANK
ncbi:MAG: O-antigen ligase family protein [Ignavibacteriota bacterium]